MLLFSDAEAFVQTAILTQHHAPIWFLCLSVHQWLESIEVMKSALQQKMLDLESEKVNFIVIVHTQYFSFNMLSYLNLKENAQCLM